MEAHEEMYHQQQPQLIPHTQMSDGLLQYQLDSNDIIDDIVNALSGKAHVFNPDSGTLEWKNNENAIKHINEKGMAAILVPLRSVVTKVFILSDFDSDQIEDLSISIGHNMVDHLNEHWEEYDVKSISSASLIVQTIVNAVFASLSKAKGANYLHFLKTAQRIVETQHYSGGTIPTPQQQESRMSRVPILGKLFK